VTLNSLQDSDTSEAKTIPAAALPDEIRELRAKLLAGRKAASENETQPVGPWPSPKDPTTSTDPAPSRDPGAETDPVGQRNALIAKTIPGGVVSPLAPLQGPAAPGPTTGETHSITRRASPAPWSKTEPEERTSPNRPIEPPRPRPPSQPRTVAENPPVLMVKSADVIPEKPDDDDDFHETSVLEKHGALTPIVAMVLGVLFIAAVFAVLYALNLGPFSSSDVEPAGDPPGSAPGSVQPPPPDDAARQPTTPG
jgi:hypothetical protein